MMSTLRNKIDFVTFVSVEMANSNGDPLNGNRPRTDYNGYGEISDVCIKRKIRNRMQDLKHKIFVQSDDRCDDGYKSLSERAAAVMKGIKDKDEYVRRACETWLDVRSFGQVFAFKAIKAKKSEEEKQAKTEKEAKPTKDEGVSVGVRGPVSIHQAVSLSPIEVHSMQITKSVNSEPSEKRSSDTMGMKHMVRFGFYKIKGSINVQLAEKTGFTVDDADTIKECLRTLFENDTSAARPEGSMQVHKLYWWQHDCPTGQYPSAKVHASVSAKLRDGVDLPTCTDDYEITLGELAGLSPEEIDGL